MYKWEDIPIGQFTKFKCAPDRRGSGIKTGEDTFLIKEWLDCPDVLDNQPLDHIDKETVGLEINYFRHGWEEILSFSV